jgi:NAD(P)H-hydrate epimerase
MTVATLAAIPSRSLDQVPVVTAAQMAEVDRVAVESFGVTLLQMLELAGSHLAAVVGAELDGALEGRRIVVAVGPGNNGGGGLVAARHLINRGADVRVVLARPVLRMAEAARNQLATLIAMGSSCCVATYDLPDDELDAALRGADVVVDAILGYRADGPPHGEVQRLIGHVVRAQRPTVSLDLPSGVHPDTGATPGDAVHATATLTLALPKPALVSGPGAERAGRLYLGDIGIPAGVYAELGIAVGRLFAAGRILRLEPAP